MNKNPSNKPITVRTTPSLALIKYWGKAETQENIPATSSLAVNLDGLFTETTVSLSDDADAVTINGELVPPDRYSKFFDRIRKTLGTDSAFHAESHSNFPVSAGLASSSSGFAALAFGCCKLIDEHLDQEIVSDLARYGSASAARATLGGFTTLKKGARFAEKIFDKNHWPELRVLIAIVKQTAKKTSSREAMELARTTSPYYNTWVKSSEDIFQNAIDACRNKDLEKLGQLMRISYLGMFSTMFTSTPPIYYWEPESIQLIKKCDALRKNGIGAWETMDAGPQVKILCLEEDLKNIINSLKAEFDQLKFMLSRPGGGPEILS